MKKLLKEIFIDGLSGMASGLFATLIIGTIICQIGALIPNEAGTYLILIGKVASALTGAGIGVGVAARLKASPLVMASAVTAGMVSAFASKITAGTGFSAFSGKVRIPFNGYLVPSPTTIFSFIMVILLHLFLIFFSAKCPGIHSRN